MVRGVRAGLQPHLPGAPVRPELRDHQRHPAQRLHPDRPQTRPTSSPTAADWFPGKSQLPLPDSIAAVGPTQGALLLYKIPIVSLDNRPLELKIVDPLNAAQTASAELDV